MEVINVKGVEPVCPFCKSKIKKPKEIRDKFKDEFGNEIEGIIGFEVMKCKCGALYSYDPFCDEWDDIVSVAESHNLKTEDIQVITYHNYDYKKHIYYPDLEGLYDVTHPDAGLGHLWFIKKTKGDKNDR